MVQSYYTGFIYKFCFHDLVSDPGLDFDANAECGDGYCSFCPADDEICLIDCDVDEFLNVTEDCEPCEGICRLGCFVESKCNGCLDVACLDCPEWI